MLVPTKTSGKINAAQTIHMVQPVRRALAAMRLCPRISLKKLSGMAFIAIPVSFFKEIRGHKRMAAKALLTGWTMWIVCAALIFPLVFVGTNIGYDFEPRYPIGT